MIESSPLARSSMSFLGRTVDAPLDVAQLDLVARLADDEALVRPAVDGGELLRLEALGDLGARLQDRLGQLGAAVAGRDAQQRRALGGLAGATVWQAMHPCRWKSRSPSFGSPFSVTAAARTDSNGIEAIVGPRSGPPVSRSRSSRAAAKAAAAFTSGRSSFRRFRTWKAYFTASVRPIALSRLAAPSRRLPRRLDRPLGLGFRPRRCPRVGVQREQHGIAQLATRRVFVLGQLAEVADVAARGRRRGGSLATRRAARAGARPAARSPPARAVADRR